MSAPYTHEEHFRRCYSPTMQRRLVNRQRVQVMKRGILYCAELVDGWVSPDGVQCWTVETTYPERVRFTVPVKQVRACGDARCACSEGPGAEGAPLAGEGLRGGLEGVTC